METIKTFEDACKATGNDPNMIPDSSTLPSKHAKSIIAYAKLIIIAEALNEGWEPDWNNENQYKYIAWPWIEASKENTSGFGFANAGYVCTDTHTFVGSRLCYKSSELALYALNTFKDLYREFLLLNQ